MWPAPANLSPLIACFRRLSHWKIHSSLADFLFPPNHRLLIKIKKSVTASMNRINIKVKRFTQISQQLDRKNNLLPPTTPHQTWEKEEGDL